MRRVDDTLASARCGSVNEWLLVTYTTFHCSARGFTVAVGSNTLQNMVQSHERKTVDTGTSDARGLPTQGGE
jgi:hypothetical protein